MLRVDFASGEQVLREFHILRVKSPFLFFSCRRSRADLVVSIGVLVLVVDVLVVVVLEPLPLLSE